MSNGTSGVPDRSGRPSTPGDEALSRHSGFGRPGVFLSNGSRGRVPETRGHRQGRPDEALRRPWDRQAGRRRRWYELPAELWVQRPGVQGRRRAPGGRRLQDHPEPQGRTEDSRRTDRHSQDQGSQSALMKSRVTLILDIVLVANFFNSFRVWIYADEQKYWWVRSDFGLSLQCWISRRLMWI